MAFVNPATVIAGAVDSHHLLGPYPARPRQCYCRRSPDGPCR